MSVFRMTGLGSNYCCNRALYAIRRHSYDKQPDFEPITTILYEVGDKSDIFYVVENPTYCYRLVPLKF